MSPKSPPDHSDSFEAAAATVVGELQTALAELVSRTPGGGTRAVDVQNGLGLDKKMAWQLFTIATAETPLAKIAQIPGAPTMKRILAAAAKRKLPRTVIDRAAEAFDRFEAFVGDHGGDRSELISLASDLVPAGAGDAQHDLKVRKAVFKGMAHLWGIQAAKHARTLIIHPRSLQPARVDDALLMDSYVGLQRLRRGAPMSVFANMRVNEDPAPDGSRPVRSAPQAPTIGKPGAKSERTLELLAQFSSQPLPELSPRKDQEGNTETELIFPASGRAGAVSLCASQHMAGASEGEQSQYGMNSLINLPTEMFVTELLVPAGFTDPGTARVGIYGRRIAVQRVFDCRPIDLMPQHEAITYLGVLQLPPPIVGVPRHAEAVRYMLKRLGWEGTRFDVYRCTVQCPLQHTMVRIAVQGEKRNL